ncbi:hypothetical protein [Mesorhizobium sp. CO1-1-8]|uniref:hypothetical protein n=1 Tax=Mesorhizobium sp. CO1-1-8 TaxID=2876631 RepID=UPI001CD1420E|nr:hypothetical protein [Mesorhizobium sp. CO1-1-8]MBZ9775839.1 hypothetical protein [Mesorhizobium sp. CO1-1-8]
MTTQFIYDAASASIVIVGVFAVADASPRDCCACPGVSSVEQRQGLFSPPSPIFL